MSVTQHMHLSVRGRCREPMAALTTEGPAMEAQTPLQVPEEALRGLL